MGTFVIKKRMSGLYRYEFNSRKGKPIFTSNDFELRFECEENISLLKSSWKTAVFQKEKATSGKFFFKIFINEKQFAESRKFSTEFLLQRAIDEIHRSIENAELIDFSMQLFSFPEESQIFETNNI